MNIELLQRLVKKEVEDKLNNLGIWNLGTLISELSECPDDYIVKTNLESFASNLVSYRGYYDQLSINTGESTTVKDFLMGCKEAIGETFEGYKGGDYRMTEQTPIWVSDYGRCSNEGVSGLQVNHERKEVLILTTTDEY